MKIPLWAKLLLTAAISGGAIFLVTNVYFAGTAMPFVFFTLTLANVILVLFRVGRSWLDLPFVAVAAALLGVISVRHFHYQPNWESCVSFLGLASLVVLGLRAVWSEGEKQKILALAFAPSFLFAAFMVFAGAVLERTQIWHPKGHGLLGSSGAGPAQRVSVDGGVAGSGADQDPVLQSVPGAGARAHFPTGFSLASDEHVAGFALVV
jgi:hypothetical protein